MAIDIVEELARILDALEKSGAGYALCGGFAMGVHGHPRATRDIDLLIPPDSLEVVSKTLARLGFDVASGPIPFGAGTGKERIVHRFTKLDDADALSVDLLVVSAALGTAWDSRERLAWRNRSVSVVSRSGLVAMKRLAGRTQDLADLEALGEP